MACFISNTLLQKYYALSISPSKYPSSPNSSNTLFLSHNIIGFSPPKHTPLLVVQYVSEIPLANSYGHLTNTIDSTTGNVSPRRMDTRVETQSFGSQAMEKSTENSTSRKDKSIRKGMGFKERKKMGSENRTMRSKDATVDLSGLREKNSGKSSDESKRDDKGDSSELKLRAKLDMCSKRGDAIGAIQLFDLAQREGIKMGQYHYAAVLNLCSSPAAGVVQPGKSGSTESSSGVVNSNVKFEESTTAELDILQKSFNNGSSIEKMEMNYGGGHENLDSDFHGKQNMGQSCNAPNSEDENDDNRGFSEIRVSEDVKQYALERGFEIFENMCLEKVPMDESTLTAVARMAMSMGNGDLAFDMVKQMKPLGINPKLRSYGPALSVFCNSGDVNKAFSVEKHMLEHGVHPKQPELEALLRVSGEAGKGDKVYYLLHKLRTSGRRVSPSTADIIARWFSSKAASRVGKTKWDHKVVKQVIENGGGGWHGHGWLGKGKWTVSSTCIGPDGFCKCCGQQLATIDLDPVETEKFAESVASIAIKRDKDSSFRKFQKWLEYYGPFEAVVDGANVGIFCQRRFMPSKINAVVNGIRQKLPSKKWPLIVLHNKRISGRKMNEPVNKAFIEKWKNADALYATPTGSNDDWYWLYAAIKFKCLIVTNDEMRDHTFHLLRNDFFPKWKERHQVHFRFTDAGPAFDMPPPYSVVIQESDKGHWHFPIETHGEYEAERQWLCITRMARQHSFITKTEGSQSAKQQASSTGAATEPEHLKHSIPKSVRKRPAEDYTNLRNILAALGFPDHRTVLSEIEAAEKLGGCVIDFQI